MPRILPRETLSVLPAEFALRHRVVPLEVHNGLLRMAVCQANDWQLLGDLEFLTGKRIEAVEFSESEILDKISEVYGVQPSAVGTFGAEPEQFELMEKERDSVEDGQANGRRSCQEWDEVSVVALVNEIVTNAIDGHASDIHVEAYEQQFRVRYRIDGVLQEVRNPPFDRKQAIISRFKIMADLDIAEKRRPQDGRIRVKRGQKAIDIRVSTLPTDFGEKIVLRILDKSQLNLDLEKLGFEDNALQSFKQAISSPHGMILVTGPTGSGKTTTLYATLSYLNSPPELNILTIEDPIEYNLAGINQSQARSDIGYTFAKALRSFLRQDPDIIMVGEIRDQETAEIAVRAALTGHLVLSTLHTNDAPSAVTRLLDMGLEPFLISSSVKMVLAQRLMRKICEHCKTADLPNLANYPMIESDKLKWEGISAFVGRGCEKCNGTGYRGRFAIFEVMPMSQAIAEMVNRRATAREIKDQACEEGMRILRQCAMLKLAQGLTTVTEVLRETES
jgi:type II secretion system protein E